VAVRPRKELCKNLNEEAGIRKQVWNYSVKASDYEGAGEKYQSAILEHYKLYVDMREF
jgi:hypothetical protein